MTASFEDVYAQHHRRAFRLAFLLTGDRHEAEDVTADAFAKMFARWSEDIADPGGYVTRTVVNTANSRFRRLGTARRALPRLAGGAEHVVDTADLVARDDEVTRALALLPPRQRTVLVLRYWQDLSEAEIAATLGIAPGSVKSAASRGLARLAGLLGGVHGRSDRRAVVS